MKGKLKFIVPLVVLLALAQQSVDQRWRTYEERATAGAAPPPAGIVWPRTVFSPASCWSARKRNSGETRIFCNANLTPDSKPPFSAPAL